MNDEIRYLSVCSGIESASVAWQPLGWQCVGFSEIASFPYSVLAHHWPDVPNFGDLNDFRDWPESAIDVLVGGTPCQSFSVAGLRKGLADPRGNLALAFCGVLSRYRPRWFIWENVPGVLSSDDGRDFGSLIGAMVKLGYGVSYRVLDAQYFGVPQRRRRVFIVGNLGDWRRSVEVLFEPQSLRGDPPPRRGERENIAPDAGSRTSPNSSEADELAPATVGALTDGAHRGGGLNGQDAYTGRILATREPPIVVHGTQDPIVSDIAFPLGRNSGQENVIAFAQNQRAEVRTMETAGSLSATPGATQQTYIAGKADDDRNLFVRRLTPLECERLQGFPDGYTAIPGAKDGPRYAALGNTIAVPVLRWIGERINQELTK